MNCEVLEWWLLVKAWNDFWSLVLTTQMIGPPPKTAPCEPIWDSETNGVDEERDWPPLEESAEAAVAVAGLSAVPDAEDMPEVLKESRASPRCNKRKSPPVIGSL